MPRLMKIVRIIFVFFLIFALAFFLFIFSITACMVKPGGSRIFTVRGGESAREIAGELQKEGLVFNALAFRLLVKVARCESRIKAGDYEITSRMNSLSILQKMVRGDVMKRSFTVPEGSRIEEIANILQDNHLADPLQFIEAAKENTTIRIKDATPFSLEGYLYPDTYQVAHNATPRDIVELMVARFNEVVVPEYDKVRAKATLPLASVIILASLVEKEACLDNERPIIAGVYFNRLKKEIPLQCDATIQYALGRSKPVLTYDDLKIASPYNTYEHSGLPPGPICCPGLASIKAVLAPAKIRYLYYVVNESKGDGSHVFSISFEEHRRAIEKYRR
jgi:UPF0755 protein